MGNPLVSILVPTYNGARFLRPAIASALAQSWKDIEVLVGDDGSTDATPDVLAALAATDPRLRVIRRERNIGAFDNPRELLREARGEYVKFLLHDDVLATDCVRDLVRPMVEDASLTLAFSHRLLVGEDGRPLGGGQPAPLRDRPGRLDGRELGDHVLANCANVIGEMTTVLFRRADVDPDQIWQHAGRRYAVLGDVALWLHLLDTGDAWYSNRPLSRFRMHAAQRTWNPGLHAVGVADWVHLDEWATSSRFLADLPTRRRAYAAAALQVALRLHHTIEHGAHPALLEALALAGRRLAELGHDDEAHLSPDAPPATAAAGELVG